MKKIAIFGLLLSGVVFTAQAAGSKYSPLEGNWTGTVTKNFKKSAAGGKPSASETGAKATVELKATADGLEGKGSSGTESEKWVIKGDTYTWSDAEMSVSAKATEKIEPWAQAEIGAPAADEQVFAFQFLSCTVVPTNKPCEVKTHMPEGLEKAYWIFKVKGGNKLTTTVLYQYPNKGGTRHLSEELIKATQEPAKK